MASQIVNVVHNSYYQNANDNKNGAEKLEQIQNNSDKNEVMSILENKSVDISSASSVMRNVKDIPKENPEKQKEQISTLDNKNVDTNATNPFKNGVQEVKEEESRKENSEDDIQQRYEAFMNRSVWGLVKDRKNCQLKLSKVNLFTDQPFEYDLSSPEFDLKYWEIAWEIQQKQFALEAKKLNESVEDEYEYLSVAEQNLYNQVSAQSVCITEYSEATDNDELSSNHDSISSNDRRRSKYRRNSKHSKSNNKYKRESLDHYKSKQKGKNLDVIDISDTTSSLSDDSRQSKPYKRTNGYADKTNKKPKWERNHTEVDDQRGSVKNKYNNYTNSQDNYNVANGFNIATSQIYSCSSASSTVTSASSNDDYDIKQNTSVNSDIGEQITSNNFASTQRLENILKDTHIEK